MPWWRIRASRASRMIAAGVALLPSAVPAVAWACPVCFSATSQRVLHSYYVTAVVLTLMPFLLVGGFVVWLVRRTRNGSAGADE